jgi:hypothetical protein
MGGIVQRGVSPRAVSLLFPSDGKTEAMRIPDAARPSGRRRTADDLADLFLHALGEEAARRLRLEDLRPLPSAARLDVLLRGRRDLLRGTPLDPDGLRRADRDAFRRG